MIKIKIDNKVIKVKEGIPIIKAAKTAGIEIPAMCWREGKEHITSCMVCMVKDAKSGRLLPSCSVEALDGMDIITLDDEIIESRKTALELLLSEHVGDCEAPCQITCPAHMDIPQMNRLLAKGKFEEALEIVYRDIALPGVFGRICPAPCEGACRRKTVDSAVSICLLKRASADFSDVNSLPLIPDTRGERKAKISIIGAGPAGLSAAFYLSQRGYSVKIYDKNEKPGGSLKKEIESGVLPSEVLEQETGIITKLGTEFIMNTLIDKSKFLELRDASDVLIIATGSENKSIHSWGLEMSEKGVKAENKTYQYLNSKIFVAGSALRPAKLAIRTLGQGKEVAYSVDQFLQNDKVVGEKFMFNSRFGKLEVAEIPEYLKESVEGERLQPVSVFKGFSPDQVMVEANRCLRCDCRKPDNCKLRIYSDEYQADQRRFKSDDRKKITKSNQHDTVIYEPAKCIKCGICVDITAEYSEEYGFTFIGRGFDIEIGVPFNKMLEKGLRKVAIKAAEACPTGALSKK